MPASAARGNPVSAELLAEQLDLFLSVFAPLGECVNGDKHIVAELRALGIPGWKPDVKPSDLCGFFDLSDEHGRRALCAAVREYTAKPAPKQPEGIYLTMNPVAPVFLSRANNCMGVKGKTISASDEHIIRRRWFVVDADPKRPISGVSATDEEKAAARRLIDEVRDDLRNREFAEPMLCDSGNGYHLWYRIDLDRDDGGLVEGVLKGLARRHNTIAATVDSSTFNPSRIMKLPGTWARKGSETPDRPHRPARVLEIPKAGGKACVQ